MPGQAGSAQGQLTVTLTVAPSVGVMMGLDGQPKLICANCNDPRDNVSALKPQPSDKNQQKKQK
jgi:hypothetical protein